jgi:hypothetical protein
MKNLNQKCSASNAGLDSNSKWTKVSLEGMRIDQNKNKINVVLVFVFGWGHRQRERGET